MKIAFIAGARPNFIKIAPLMEEARKHKELTSVLIHTGQHYDFLMSQIFFQELLIPVPDYNLEVGSGSHGTQIAKILKRLEPVLQKEDPDLVVAVGDTNSTLAGALAASGLQMKIGHVEAGLRSFNKKMPEELNRIITDHCSDFLFATERAGIENLRREGIGDSRIFFVGNVMIDTLRKYIDSAAFPENVFTGSAPEQFAVLTLHRPENIDDNEIFSEVLAAVRIAAKNLPVIWPVHPRAKKRLEEFDFSDGLGGIRLIEPLGYLEMLGLMKHARVVLTDSGGIQEETTILGTPCVTLRTETERPVTVEVGTNVVAGVKRDAIVSAMKLILEGNQKKNFGVPELWDGKASERIIDTILTHV